MSLLEQYGIPEKAKFVEKKTVFECDLCKDTGWVTQRDKEGKPIVTRYDKFNIEWEQEKPCKCQVTKAKAKKLEESGLKSRFEKNNIDNFVVDTSGTKKALEKFRNFVGNYEMNTLVITGATGTGKTHLGTSAINEIMLNDNVSPKDVEVAEFVSLISRLKQAIRFDSEYSENDILTKLREVKILYIDDLFKLSHDNQAVRWMFDIINYRYNERESKKLTTIITSEHSLLEIYSIDSALGGRLIEMASKNVIELNEKNRRIK